MSLFLRFLFYSFYLCLNFLSNTWNCLGVIPNSALRHLLLAVLRILYRILGIEFRIIVCKTSALSAILNLWLLCAFCCQYHSFLITGHIVKLLWVELFSNCWICTDSAKKLLRVNGKERRHYRNSFVSV